MRLLLVDDHAMMRDGLRALLEKAAIDVIGEAASGHDALIEARRLHPEIVIMDISMPGLNGIDATRRLLSELPETKVVALSMNTDRRYVTAMLAAGAVGYLIKNSASEELLDALEAVRHRATFVSPALRGGDLDRAMHALDARRGRPLTIREREVLQLIAEGKSSKEVGTILGIAVTTVETHRRQLSEKLGLRTIAELTKYAIREGLTSGDP